MGLTKVSGDIIQQPIDVGIITATSINASGVITASSFSGDGSNLTGIDATTLKDSNGDIQAQATTSGVGIGTTIPGHSLDVLGSIQSQDSTDARVRLKVGGANIGALQATTDAITLYAAGGSSKIIRLQTSGQERLRVTHGGNVGIASTQPSTVLDVGGNGSMKIPFGTNAQRPAGSAGEIRINTEARAIEFHTGVGWALAGQVPEISSVTGDFFVGMPGPALTITGTAFDDLGMSLLVYDGNTLIDTLTGSNLTATTFQVTVSSTIYNSISNGDTLSLVARTSGNIESDPFSKAVQNTPTGGTITSTGDYRVHTFTSASTNFVVPSGFSATADYVIVAGGGSGGNNQAGSYENGGGGGAGGMITGNTSISAQTYTIQVGAGGAIPSGNGQTKGGNSSALGVTATGGGGGSTRDSQANINGGSGGGAVNWNPNTTRGTGISGQGNNGGTAGQYGDTNGGSAGGGGKGAVGGSVSGNNNSTGANGGAGGGTTIRGSSETFAGGGGGGGGTGGSGGSGGGGAAGSSGSQNGSNGGTNTGGGGGGNFAESGATAGNGGSGIVIIRYKKT